MRQYTDISSSSRRGYGDKGDDELMIAYQAGDKRAFDELYRRFKQPLYSFLTRQSGGESVSGELFQDVWLRVISSSKRYSSRGRFRSWLFTLAHNRLVDYYRQKDRTPVGEILTETAAADGRTPEEDVLLTEKVELLRTAMALLPRLQDALLRELHGLYSLERVRDLGFDSMLVHERLALASETVLGAGEVTGIALSIFENRKPGA